MVIVLFLSVTRAGAGEEVSPDFLLPKGGKPPPPPPQKQQQKNKKIRK